MKLEQHKNVFYKNIGTYMALINNELKKEYPLEPLSNHIKMVGGYAFKSSHYLSEGIPVIRISDFQNEKIELTSVKYYEESNDLERYELTAGDVIIAMTGGTIGKLAIVQDGLGKLYLNQRVGKFQVLNSNEFEDEYVYWLARGIQDIVQKLGYGGAQPNVSNKQVEALEFAFPERKIQRKIIAFLNDLKENKTNGHYFNSNVESKISNVQNTSVKLNTIKNDAVLNELFISKLKDSILQEAVQGKLTVDWRANNPTTENASLLLKNIQEEKAQLVRDKKIKKEKSLPAITKEEIPYELPEGWVWCRLGTVTDIIAGASFKSGDFNQTGGIKCIKITNAGVRDFVETDDFLPKNFNDLYPNYLIKEGDLILALTRPYIKNGLKISICPPTYNNSLLNQRVASIRSMTNKIYHPYIFSFIQSPNVLNHYKSKFDGKSQQPNMKMCDITDLLISIPPIEEQKVIVQKVNTLTGLCDKLVQVVQQSQEQSDKLTQSVMRESLVVNTTF